MSAEPPLPLVEVLRRVLATVEPQLGPDGAFRFAMQVWAESFRNPAFADLVRRIYGQLRGHFEVLARHAVQAGELPPETDIEGAGAALFGLVPGYGVQRVLIGHPDPETYLAGVRALLDAKMSG